MKKLSKLSIGLGEGWVIEITEALDVCKCNCSFLWLFLKVKVKTDCGTSETMAYLLGMSLAAELDILCILKGYNENATVDTYSCCVLAGGSTIAL